MTLLVFGKTGQVATELRRQADVVALGRTEVDLSVSAACAAAIETYCPQAVINAAAYTGVDGAEEEAELAFLINGEAPGAMAVAAAHLGIPFVHLSTDYVFDGSGEKPWKPSDPVAPLGVYGASKLEGERAVLAAGGNSVVLRTSWVFSAHGSNFLKTMLRLSETRDRLTVVSDQIGGPTPASGIAAACLEIVAQLRNGRGVPGLYHFAGLPNVSWANFAREIFRTSGRNVKVADIPSSEYPTPAARPCNSRLDCSGFEEAFAIARPDWRESATQIVRELSAA